MKKIEHIEQLTNSLIEYLNVLEEKFNDEEKGSMKSQTFFQYVKTDSEDVFSTLKKWEELTSDEIKKGNLSIPIQMIHSTKENMSALIMHSYYKDVRRRRYMEINRSCLYTFHLILKEI